MNHNYLSCENQKCSDPVCSDRQFMKSQIEALKLEILDICESFDEMQDLASNSFNNGLQQNLEELQKIRIENDKLRGTLGYFADPKIYKRWATPNGMVMEIPVLLNGQTIATNALTGEK